MMHSPNVKVNGIFVSRQGDVNTPHLFPPKKPPCPTHAMPITYGDSIVRVNGRGCGRVGDNITACTKVAQGSPNVFAWGPEGEAAGAPSAGTLATGAF